MNNKPIYVTQPSLASIDDYTELLKGVWERGILTHNGPLVQQFEKEMSRKLNIAIVCYKWNRRPPNGH